ncbi:Polyprenol-phosphate-mannose-dependent alpha-(1-2)-phosphatidylinositol mannoside mannosyltransferase [Glutamicibacter creatinolyticus]|uniref:Polyprenol-phosphate-mannose-dependent alpha-(1-2)-phosphatidylinositol mannoside mannosyltransferase n=1 Tax=Glutamicibacter creatinolyticus TaxID=162496 RepID=A0A5B7WTC6_9MICC|nr:glycosyltransferase 87 family protein [Glutamicibacter creatinolyticus]QCY46495.1 Polyprenol-phosphate-mannose-dependent alpha-(1-2)-phosphatidylinositol mannoside mannosyltransferase [Glutamicibacter creatinolyticus]
MPLENPGFQASITPRQWLSLFRRPWFLLGLAAALGIVLLACPLYGLDFRVYREGAKVLFAGLNERSLYDPMPQELGTRGLPFTYPPFAAALFLPFALLPATLGMVLITATTLLCLVGAALLAVGYIHRHGALGWFAHTQLRRGLAVLLAITLIGVSGPWRDSLDFGQINAMIMALIVIDVVRPGRWLPRGVLIGVAAGIKLTPLAFGLIFLARRDLRSLFGMAGGFAATIAVGWLVAGGESMTFWSSLLESATRVGDPAAMYNLSLNSLLFHLGLEGSAQKLAWAAACLGMVLLGYAAIRLAQRRGDVLAAISVNALVMLAISPVSWFHHWVWIALGLPVVWVAAWRRRGIARALGRGLCLVLVLAFSLSSYAWTILVAGKIFNSGPWGWEMYSSLGLLASLTAVAGALVTRQQHAPPADAEAGAGAGTVPANQRPGTGG